MPGMGGGFSATTKPSANPISSGPIMYPELGSGGFDGGAPKPNMGATQAASSGPINYPHLGGFQSVPT